MTVEPLDGDPATSEIVATDDGTRFHRPGWRLFETACTTRFGHPIRELTVTDALAAGFTPCGKPACFGSPEG